jgi:glycosyltransferase involved in cell wall biosynthesis
MRIAYVVQRYLPAPLTGSERYIQILAEGLRRDGYKVDVLTSNAYDWDAFIFPFKKRIQKKEEIVNGVKIKRFPIHYEIYVIPTFMRLVLSRIGIENDLLNLLANGPFIPDIYFYIKNSNYELVHATPFPFSIVWFSWLASRKASLPFVVTPLFHIHIKQYYNEYLKQILTNCEAIIALTNIEKEKLIGLGAPRDRVHVIPLGINVSEYKNTDGERFKRKYRLSDHYIILYTAPKVPEKGALQVLRTMSIVQKYIPNAILVAIGRRSKQWINERRKLKNIRVIDLDWVSEDEKRDVFAACDVFVMPSKTDSYGFVYLEAWAMGKPVIGARAGAIPDVIRDGVDGFLVKFGDSLELAEKLLFLWKNPSIREKMGENGKQRILTTNNWKNLIEKYKEIYENVTNSTPKKNY